MIHIQPDQDTDRRLRTSHCRFRQTPNQATLFGFGGASAREVSAETLRFNFWARDQAFFNYTDLPIRRNRQPLLYSNDNASPLQRGDEMLQVLQMQLSENRENDDIHVDVNPPLGVISLDLSNPALPEDRRLLSDVGTLQPQHYTIRFAALELIWRYVLIGLEDSAAHIDGIEGIRFGPPQAIEINGRQAQEIRSLSPIASRHSGDSPTLHYTAPNGRMVLRPLPRPTPHHNADGGAVPTVDIYVDLPSSGSA